MEVGSTSGENLSVPCLPFLYNSCLETQWYYETQLQLQLFHDMLYSTELLSSLLIFNEITEIM